MRWYREHGYQFLVLTDHNFVTSVDGLNALHGADEKFLVMKGEEVIRSLRRRAAPHQRPRRRLTRRAAGRHVGRRCVTAQRGRHSPRQRRSTHQSPELRMGDLRSSNWGRSATIDCSKSSMAIRRSTTSAAAACPDSKRPGTRFSRAERCFTGLPSTTRIRSSNREIRTCPDRAGAGSWYARHGSRRAPCSTPWNGRAFYASTGVELADYQATERPDRGHRQSHAVLEVPDSIRRQRRQAAEGGGGRDRHLRHPWRRGLRPRESDREQRTNRMVPARHCAAAVR